VAQTLNPISNEDIELLSAYLDDELGISQRAALEMRLTSDPNLAAHLSSLRRTIEVVRAVPQVKPPRNFTLDPARYTRRPAWWMRTGFIQSLGTLGAAASVLLILGGVFLSSGAGSFSASAPQQAANSNGNIIVSTAGADAIAAVPTNLSSPTAMPTLAMQLNTATSESALAKSAGLPTETSTATLAGTAARYAAPTLASPDQLQDGSGNSSGGINGFGGGAPGNPPQVQPNPIMPEAGAQNGPTDQNAQGQTSAQDSAAAANSGAASDAAVLPPMSPAPTQTVQAAVLAAEAGTSTATQSDTMLSKAEAVTATSVVNQPTIAALVPTTDAIGGNKDTASERDDLGNNSKIKSVTVPLPQILFSVGLGLLVLSLMLLGLNWIRRRSGNSIG
jgi:hypothetical protein